NGVYCYFALLIYRLRFLINISITLTLSERPLEVGKITISPPYPCKTSTFEALKEKVEHVATNV
ncbi:hypothetical protein KIV40_29245, partial [Vibrio sp. D173a]|uniref:hypothetical protein n=1 Tax=Vibrio sp. D173a TaxID=2836349 RepID=UPI0025543370